VSVCPEIRVGASKNENWTKKALRQSSLSLSYRSSIITCDSVISGERRAFGLRVRFRGLKLIPCFQWSYSASLLSCHRVRGFRLWPCVLLVTAEQSTYPSKSWPLFQHDIRQAWRDQHEII